MIEASDSVVLVGRIASNEVSERRRQRTQLQGVKRKNVFELLSVVVFPYLSSLIQTSVGVRVTKHEAHDAAEKKEYISLGKR